MMNRCAFLFILACLTAASGLDTDEAETEDLKALGSKSAKLFPIFNVVKFKNDPCTASPRNGTCYLAEQCDNRGGSSSGSCADGFGVCCIFVLGCGSTSTENCTYLVMASTTTPPANCQYTICRTSDHVCRLRLDFNTNVIAGPVVGTAIIAAPAVATPVIGGSIGDCTTDRMTVSGRAGSNSPVICGTNTGQHLYIDADTCNNVNFNLQSGSSVMWDIKVTQYNCGDEMAGPPGCLQYFTATTGTIMSFNFPATNSVPATATHLSDQDYSMCFRRASGFCYICYTPSINPAAPATIAQASYGLSSTDQTAPMTGTDTQCSTDYLMLPGTGGVSEAIAQMNNMVGTTRGRVTFCGRFFGTTTAAKAASTTVCTNHVPFRMRFRTDSTEAEVSPPVNSMDTEAFGVPAGIIGFKLNYFQGACS